MQGGGLTDWLSSLSLTGVVLTMFASMLVAALAGHAVHELQRRWAEGREEVERSQESYLVGSMLGLLALLLAFSFSMALDRYEERRHLVVQEANAIGTAYLRAQLLDEPHRSRLSGLLVAYTDNRIVLATGPSDEGDRRLAMNDRLMTDIWAAVTAARESANAHGITTALLMTFNEVIDLDTERKVARQVRVPAPVLLLLYGFLVLTAAVLGYVLEERRALDWRRRAVRIAVSVRQHHRRPQSACFRQYQGIAGADADASAVAEIAAAGSLRPVQGVA